VTCLATVHTMTFFQRRSDKGRRWGHLEGRAGEKKLQQGGCPRERKTKEKTEMDSRWGGNRLKKNKKEGHYRICETLGAQK